MASDDSGSGFVFYHYDPSAAAAIIFIVVFAILTIIHVYQLVRTRTWFFIAFAVGGVFEAVGYVGRILSHNEYPDFTEGPYIIQSILLLVAPAFFAASIYMTLGRIILLTDGEPLSIIRRRWLTKLFVAGDVLSFIMQGAGGGIMASGTSTALTTGKYVVIGGLAVQIIFFSLFIVTATIFHKRLIKTPTDKVLGHTYLPWKEHMLTLYLGSFIILVRSAFRVVEYAMGYNGYLMSNEWPLYIFDALLMTCTMAIFVVRHPSEINALLKGGHGKVVHNVVGVRSVV